MKRKILVILAIIFSLFVMACGKSEDGKPGILDNLKKEENIAGKNLKKYNSYIDLYDILAVPNAIDIFDEEYLQKIVIEDGEVKKIEKDSIQNFGSGAKINFVPLDEAFNAVKNYLNEKPKYKFDSEVEKLVDTYFKLKDKIFVIIEYYNSGQYEIDNYAQTKKLDEEYEELIGTFFEYTEIYLDNLEELTDESNRILIKELEKSGEIVALSMLKFVDTTNKYIDLLYDRQDFFYSDKELEELKELNKNLVQELTNLEAMTDKQLEKEDLDKNKFRNNFTKKAKELIKMTTAIIEKIEKEKDINSDLDNFDRAYSEVIEAYNSII